MANRSPAKDWPLKNITAATVITATTDHDHEMEMQHANSPYQAHNGWGADTGSGVKQKQQKRFIASAIATLALATVVLIIAIGLLAHYGTRRAPLLVALVTVSGGVVWLLGTMLAFIVLTRSRNKGVARVDDDGFELQNVEAGTRRNRSPTGPRFAYFASQPCLPALRRPRERMSHRHNHAQAQNRGPTSNTPLKANNRASTMPGTEHSPFNIHPNPLASSPILSRAPPPTFPSPALLRGSKLFERPKYLSGSPTRTSGPYGAHDPFRASAGMEVRSASEVSLTTGQAQEVDVLQIARSDSVKRIRAATARREGLV